MNTNALLKGTGLEFKHPEEDGLIMNLSVWLDYAGDKRPENLDEVIALIENTPIFTEAEPTQLTAGEARTIPPNPYRKHRKELTPQQLKELEVSEQRKRTQQILESLETAPTAPTSPISLSTSETDMNFSVGETSLRFSFGNQKKLLLGLANRVGQDLTKEELAKGLGIPPKMAEMNFMSLMKQLNEHDETHGILTTTGNGLNQRFRLNSPLLIS